MITERELWWLAGLIEGEGSFHNGNNRPRLVIGMVDPDVIQRAATILGVPKIYTRTLHSGKSFHSISLSGKRAIRWMLILYPALGVRRRAQIETLLRSYSKITDFIR